MNDSAGHNLDPIITKLSTNVGLVKLQFEFEDKLCGANIRGRTFINIKSFETFERSYFITIVTKLRIFVGLIKSQILYKN